MSPADAFGPDATEWWNQAWCGATTSVTSDVDASAGVNLTSESVPVQMKIPCSEHWCEIICTFVRSSGTIRYASELHQNLGMKAKVGI